MRRTLAPMLGVTEADIDMIEVDVGGGFGVKGEASLRVLEGRARIGVYGLSLNGKAGHREEGGLLLALRIP